MPKVLQSKCTPLLSTFFKKCNNYSAQADADIWIFSDFFKYYLACKTWDEILATFYL